MPRRIGRIKWYAATACVAVAAAATSGGVALAQTASGPTHISSNSGSGPGTQAGPDGQFVPGDGSAAPVAPTGSTTYSSRGSGSGKTVKSYRASVRNGAEAAGPSLHSSDGGSGPGTQSGPDGQFVPGDGSGPPPAPAGSTTYSSHGSGNGRSVKSYRS